MTDTELKLIAALLQKLQLAYEDFAAVELANDSTARDGGKVGHRLRFHATILRALTNCRRQRMLTVLLDRSGGEQQFLLAHAVGRNNLCEARLAFRQRAGLVH